MFTEKMRAWASMADDPIKRASSHSSSPLRRYNPSTLAAGGVLLVGVAYFMFKGKEGRGRQSDQPVPPRP
ncbi:hypothetical protein E2562_019139 [Oryza meyeriana var. granulata]|uniref:Uncharacterized protein n=1 Tax=Oryza meyeriana var. granulata TaxID=110450 RepID=A0A6G1CSI1_9ORYZ|nr:hypothetical protein E2562_019139 [Oryza meyeriana var. granulata]